MIARHVNLGLLAARLAFAAASVVGGAPGCAHPSDPEPAKPPSSAPASSSVAAAIAPAASDAGAATDAADAGAAADAAAPKAASGVKPNVKVVTVGMHVAGGPFDEPTKEPFKQAVEPHFPEIAQCWADHVPHPPKQADVGVDLLIEPSGGHPKISNPRSTLPGLGKDVVAETTEFMPCVIAVFESVTFPKLVDRGRTGVSYSLRFVPK